VAAVTNSATIAEALERAARSGFERRWVEDGFETMGHEELADIVFEVVSRNGMNWIWKEDPVVDIVDIVDPVDIIDVDVTLGSIDNCGEFWDEYTGERLPSEEVARARSDEIDGLKQYGVFEKVSVEECWKETGKRPIGVRWIDCNKGDAVHPNFRSRLVAKEIKKDSRIDLFAATPPLEPKNILFSLAVTEGCGYDRGSRDDGVKLEFIDIRKAYFNAPARRAVYVELPTEISEPGTCGRLLKSLYGTRDAAQNWEVEYSRFMESIGFVRGASTPCAF